MLYLKYKSIIIINRSQEFPIIIKIYPIHYLNMVKNYLYIYIQICKDLIRKIRKKNSYLLNVLKKIRSFLFFDLFNSCY